METHGGTIKNCINIGELVNNSYNVSGGIATSVHNQAEINILNCLNVGRISIKKIETNENCGNGIVGYVNYQDSEAAVNIKNCVNIGNGCANSILPIQANRILLHNNYYDKQMCTARGVGGEDIEGGAEGRLTTQLVGTSPELQAMLGDGWSYAEGRYPIPLGLENHPLAQLAATPIFLHYEDENLYDHVDSVTKHFTVGLENNVQWDNTTDHYNINGKNVTLLQLGREDMTFRIDKFSANIIINIVEIPLSANAGEDRHICLDNEATNALSCNIVGGIPPYFYEWSIEPNNINLYASEIISDTTIANPQFLSSIENGSEITFYLKVTDAIGTAVFDTIVLSFTRFSQNSASYEYTISQGDSVFLEQEPNICCGYGTTTYQWQPCEGLNTCNLATGFWARPEQSTNYYAVVTDSKGCTMAGDVFYRIIVEGTDVEEVESSAIINIFPNPAQDFVNIEIGKIEADIIEIYDLAGKIIKSDKIDHAASKIFVGDLENGVYVLKILANDKIVMSGKFCKE